ncbi:MAG TPA: protease complex subunit PrcB family protein [Stellaceae bacterium]|nr:protease complex subunit PrcB family protein [Stellaceae bacterium]
MTDGLRPVHDRRSVLAGVTAAIAGALCSGGPARAQSTEAPVPSEIWRGQLGGGGEKRIETLADAAAWENAWRRIDRPPPAAFDAARHRGLFASQGQKPTGGFRVEVVSARREPSFVRVILRDAAPAPDMIVTQALAEPWAILLLETVGLSIEAGWAP